MESLLHNILDYITFLKTQFALSISLHLDQEYSLKCYALGFEKLLSHSIHLNPYCLQVKADGKRYEKCMRCQKRVLFKCQTTQHFEGTCLFGVAEFVHGVYVNQKPVGFVSVSGYQSKRPPLKGLSNLYDRNMKKHPLPSSLLCDIIPPLCRMTEYFIRSFATLKESPSPQKTEYQKILYYLYHHHATTNLEEVCRIFHRSKSFISHLFKKNSGYSLPYYCNLLKINSAKELLKNTDLSVTEVSLAVGFNDLSYFITFFKKINGLSPLQWKKTHSL